MANGPWIESHASLARHPKTARLVRLLGISKPAAIGHLHLLWWWSLEYAEDGDLRGFSNDDIADAAMWEGDPAVFGQALRDAGFIEPDDRIHDWHDYAGRLIAQRKANAERQAAFRNGHKLPSPPADNNPSIGRNGDVTARDISPNGHVTVTSPLRSAPTVPITVPTTKTVDDPPLPPAASNGHTAATLPGADAPVRAVTKSEFDFGALWTLVTEQQGYKPTWDYKVETSAVKRLLAAHPSARAPDLAAFLAYVGTCWPFCDEPTRQPTFSEGAKHFGAWFTNGRPAVCTQGDSPHARSGSRDAANLRVIAERRAARHAGSADPEGVPLRLPAGPGPRRVGADD